MRIRSFITHFSVALIANSAFLFSPAIFSQDSVLELFPETEQTAISAEEDDCASLFIDAGSFLMPLRDSYVNGLSLKVGGAKGSIRSGFAFSFINSRTVFLPYDQEVTSPRYTSIFFGWDHEYICNPEKRIHVSLAMRAGFGYSEYSDNAALREVYYYATNDSSSYHTPVHYYSSGLIASNFFFLIQPGINVLCDLTSWLAIGAGVNSRIVFAISKESMLRDDGYCAGSLFLRFKMPGKRDL